MLDDSGVRPSSGAARLHRLVRRTIEVKQWLVERSAMPKGKICLNEGEMLDPENPRQGGDHLSRFMTEKMFHHS